MWCFFPCDLWSQTKCREPHKQLIGKTNTQTYWLTWSQTLPVQLTVWSFTSYCSTFPCVTGSDPLVALHPHCAGILYVWQPSSYCQHHFNADIGDSERWYALCNTWATEKREFPGVSLYMSDTGAVNTSLNFFSVNHHAWKQQRTAHHITWDNVNVNHQASIRPNKADVFSHWFSFFIHPLHQEHIC